MAIHIERGTELLIARSRTITPVRAVTETNSFVLIHSTSSDTSTQGAGLWRLAGNINSDGDLELNKGSNATPTGSVSYQIVSCDAGEFSVQVSPVTLSTTQTTNTGTIEAVDIDRTHVIGGTFTIGSPSQTLSNCVFCTFELTDATTLTATRAAHQSIQLRVRMQAITWAPWTGVKVHTGEHTLNTNLSSKVASAHGMPDIDPDFTWLSTSISHQSTGLEQCAMAINLLDSSGVNSSTNIYYQRYDQTTSYSSTIRWYLIRFPDGSISIDNIDSSDSGTGTGDTITTNISMEPDGVIVDWTNSCNGTGTAFGRPFWYMSGFNLLGGNISSINLVRGYSGQACINVTTMLNLGNFRPANPTVSLGVNF